MNFFLPFSLRLVICPCFVSKTYLVMGLGYFLLSYVLQRLTHCIERQKNEQFQTGWCCHFLKSPKQPNSLKKNWRWSALGPQFRAHAHSDGFGISKAVRILRHQGGWLSQSKDPLPTISPQQKRTELPMPLRALTEEILSPGSPSTA